MGKGGVIMSRSDLNLVGHLHDVGRRVPGLLKDLPAAAQRRHLIPDAGPQSKDANE